MTQSKTQIGDVTYNAATQSFEALVTFHTDAGRMRIPSSFAAPLDAPFAHVTDGLWHNARKLLSKPDALHARLHARREVIARQGRRAARLPAWLRPVAMRRAA